MATEAISYLTAHSSEAATQRRNAVVRYRLQLLDRRDATANAFVPIASSGPKVDECNKWRRGMPIDPETVFSRFVEMLGKRLDVDREGSTKVLYLHRRTNERESAPLLRKLGIGKGDFGLYVPESSVEWWGVRKPIFEKLKRIYGDKWVLILLDNHPESGYFYTPEDVRNSAPSWSPDVTGDNLKIVASTLGHHKSFYNADAFWALLQEAGGTWK